MNLDSLGFKFKIGDVVRHIATGRPTITITSRIAQEYFDGVELQYDGRVIGNGVISNIVTFTECELAVLKEEPAQTS